MLFTVTSRLRTTELLLRDSEKMAQLGTLTAGIAHELNNPSAAVQRRSGRPQERQPALNRLNLSSQQWEKVIELERLAHNQADKPSDIDPLARSDREFELETWLDEQGIEDAWELAPLLVNLKYDTGQLESLADIYSTDELAEVIPWMG